MTPIKKYNEYITESNGGNSIYDYYFNAIMTDWGTDYRPYAEGKIEITGEYDVTDNGFIIFNYNILNQEELGVNETEEPIGGFAIYKDTIGEIKIVDRMDSANKFLYKKDVIRFIDELESVYNRENNNLRNSIMGKLNNTTLSAVKDGGFCEAVKTRFGSFEKMKGAINLERMYR